MERIAKKKMSMNSGAGPEGFSGALTPRAPEVLAEKSGPVPARDASRNEGGSAQDRDPREVTDMADLLSYPSRLYPDKDALLDDGEGYTFRQLKDLSTGFASFLLSLDVRRGDRIAFCSPKSTSLVVAILGCLKAGAIYVPVDTKVPTDRILFILNDVSPRFIVSSQELYDKVSGNLSSPTTLIVADDLPESFQHDGDGASLPAIAPEDVAYCLYTSGSTGRPKGVLIQHGSVAVFYRALAEVMTLDSSSRCMNTSELYFDVHVMDLFFPLSRGATVHLSCGPMIANRLLKRIEEKRISHFTAVGPVMTLMSEGSLFEECDLSSLVRIMTGAEIINVDTMQKWLRKVPGLSLVNGYGPTEATVICTAFIIDRVEPGRSAFYPIGRPLRDSEVLLLDGDRVVSSPGEEGELLIAGPQVMKGYWNNEKHTAEKIIEIGGIRYYRSGDICRWAPSGDLEYIGRNDEQVKVSGFRINLNEIKRVMDSAPMVREGHPIVTVHSALGKVIAACFTSVQCPSTDDGLFLNLQRFFKENLPYYMVPSLYFLFDEFPKLPSGKTDKKEIAGLATGVMGDSDTRLTRFHCTRGQSGAG